MIKCGAIDRGASIADYSQYPGEVRTRAHARAHTNSTHARAHAIAHTHLPARAHTPTRSLSLFLSPSLSLPFSLPPLPPRHSHSHSHARTHTRTHARTHALPDTRGGRSGRCCGCRSPSWSPTAPPPSRPSPTAASSPSSRQLLSRRPRNASLAAAWSARRGPAPARARGRRRVLSQRCGRNEATGPGSGPVFSRISPSTLWFHCFVKRAGLQTFPQRVTIRILSWAGARPWPARLISTGPDPRPNSARCGPVKGGREFDVAAPLLPLPPHPTILLSSLGSARRGKVRGMQGFAVVCEFGWWGGG